VGSFRQQAELNQANLLGLGYGLSIGYSHTDSSNTLNADYILPLNPRNGTLQLSIGASDSEVIEEPFDLETLHKKLVKLRKIVLEKVMISTSISAAAKNP